MIGYLEGALQSRLTDGVILLTPGGVGYEVHLPAPLLAGLPEPGAMMRVHVVTIVREGEISLYGFGDASGKALFELLITVSGIGPKAALAFLSAFAPPELKAAIIRRDDALLSTIPGIGKKTATRLCVDLADKLAREAPSTHSDTLGDKGELRSALTNLGFQEKDVLAVLQKLPADSPDFSDQLKQALALLGKH